MKQKYKDIILKVQKLKKFSKVQQELLTIYYEDKDSLIKEAYNDALRDVEELLKKEFKYLETSEDAESYYNEIKGFLSK
jgi:hypothetical protein